MTNNEITVTTKFKIGDKVFKYTRDGVFIVEIKTIICVMRKNYYSISYMCDGYFICLNDKLPFVHEKMAYDVECFEADISDEFSELDKKIKNYYAAQREELKACVDKVLADLND